MIELPRLALSVRQPWPWAIFNVGKDIENRNWPTQVRGRVCIHASKGMTFDDWKSGAEAINYACGHYPGAPRHDELPRGGIVGTVEIIDCVRQSDSPWFFGSHGFVLRDPQPCDFIPVNGKLGFFDWRRRMTVAAGDYPDAAALGAAEVPDGGYATCLALGLVRVGKAVP